jgi:hypothetical protein
MKGRVARSRRTRRPSPFETWLLGRGAGAPIVRFLIVWAPAGLLWLILVFAAGRPLAPLPTWLSWLPFPLDAFWQTASLFFSAPVLVHLIPVAAALWLGFRICAHYLADLFELEGPSLASRYLWPALFGLDVLSYPRLDIATGNMDQLDPSNPLVAVGGPGYLKIHLGHAAVVEGMDGIPRVYGPARLRFLSGFERIRDVVDLRDQAGRVEMVRGVTRDGIEVQARDAQMVFRVYRGEGKQRSLEDPYPYDEGSIRHLVYARPVEEGGRRNWADELPERVRSEIRNFLERSTIEEFLALRPQAGPGGASESFEIPREALTARFHAPEHTQRLRQAGLELDWVGVGTWELGGPGLGVGPETGVPETLITGWREKERLELYTSPEYLERQQARGFREAVGAALQELVESWRGDGSGQEPQTASLVVIHRLHERLSRLRDQARSDPHLRLPVDFEEVLRHLASLLEPRWMGGGPP